MTTSEARTSHDARWLWRALLALVVLSGPGVNAFLSWSFFQAHAYRSYDVIFDADPNLHYAYLAGLSGTSMRHPLELLLLHPAALIALWLGPRIGVHLVAGLLVWLGAVEGAAKSIFLVLALRRMGLSYPWVVVLTAVDTFAFSRLTVGSLPESFPLSAACLMAMFWLAAELAATRTLVRWRWIACGVCVMGATITNAVGFLLVLFVVLWHMGSPLRQALRSTAVVGLQVVVIVACLFGGMKLAFHARSLGKVLPQLTQAAEQVEGASPGTLRTPAPTSPASTARAHGVAHFLRIAPLYEARILPMVDTYAFTGPLPAVEPIDRMQAADHFTAWERSAPGFGFVLDEHAAWDWVAPMMLVLGSLGLGIAGWMSTRERAMMLAALAVLVFNFALHALWGSNELYLYVLHWQPALMVVLAGLFFLRQRWSIVLPMVLLGAEAVWNFRDLRWMLERLGR